MASLRERRGRQKVSSHFRLSAHPHPQSRRETLVSAWSTGQDVLTGHRLTLRD